MRTACARLPCHGASFGRQEEYHEKRHCIVSVGCTAGRPVKRLRPDFHPVVGCRTHRHAGGHRSPPRRSPRLPGPHRHTEPATYTPGVLTEDGYTNTSLGFMFSPSESMVLATEEEMQALMQNGADFVYGDAPNSDQLMEQVQQTSGYEMVAVDVATGSSVSIATETLALEGIDETQYIAALKQQLAQVDSLQVTFDDPGTVTLGRHHLYRHNLYGRSQRHADFPDHAAEESRRYHVPDRAGLHRPPPSTLSC